MYKSKKKSSIVSSITIALILVIALLSGVIATAEGPLYDVQFELTSEVDNSGAKLQQVFTATYTITPRPIPANTVEEKEKEIVLVLDTSTSMEKNIAGYGEWDPAKRRINIAKNAAKKFVNSLKGKGNIKITLIDYNHIAYDNYPFTDNFNFINNKIDSLVTSHGTNIGDALRKAYYKLTKTGSPDAEKYIVFLTDGEPSSFNVNRNNEGFYIGEGSNYRQRNEWDNWAWQNEEKGKKYAIEVVENLINKSSIPINTYMVAFAEGDNAMQELAARSGGVFKHAGDADTLSDVYDEIHEEITQSMTIKNGRFEDKFPAQISIVNPEGLVVNGQKVSKTFPDIVYTLNAAKTEYTAPPIVFSIQLRANLPGDYTLGLDQYGNKTSKFVYEDLDGTTKVEYFDPLPVSIEPFDAPTIELVSKTKVGEEMKATIRIYVPEGAQKVDFYRVNSDGRRYGSTTYGKYLIGDEDYVEFTDIKFSMYEDYYIKAVAVSKYDSELTSESAPTQIHKKININ
jgi:hypothetical protein